MRRKGRREESQEKGPLLSNFSALYWEPARETLALKSSGCLLCSYLMLDQRSSISVYPSLCLLPIFYTPIPRPTISLPSAALGSVRQMVWSYGQVPPRSRRPASLLPQWHHTWVTGLASLCSCDPTVPLYPWVCVMMSVCLCEWVGGGICVIK